MKPAKKNKASAYQHLAIIDYYFSFELSVGHVAGFFPLLLLPNLHVNIAGLTPKKGQPNKWRLILVTSSPFGFSVDDGIRPKTFHFSTFTWTTSLMWPANIVVVLLWLSST